MPPWCGHYGAGVSSAAGVCSAHGTVTSVQARAVVIQAQGAHRLRLPLLARSGRQGPACPGARRGTVGVSRPRLPGSSFVGNFHARSHYMRSRYNVSQPLMLLR